jgi:hypothetical protein
LSNRNNLERTGAHSQATDAPPSSPLDFVTPTEFVELPSRGNGYPEGHALRGKEVIEIRFMTAKDEDILTSQTLLKKGLALERFIQNILVDKGINSKSILVGDRNAIIVAARASGYGHIYETQVSCPSCGAKQEEEFDISNPEVTESKWDDSVNITKTDSGTFIARTPMTNFDIELKLLTGEDEIKLAALTTNKRKKKLNESIMTDQFKQMIVSISGYDDRQVINKYVDVMPAQDSRFLRNAYKLISPNVRIIKNFSCDSCGHVQELEVPFGADFFWPDS